MRSRHPDGHARLAEPRRRVLRLRGRPAGPARAGGRGRARGGRAVALALRPDHRGRAARQPIGGRPSRGRSPTRTAPTAGSGQTSPRGGPASCASYRGGHRRRRHRGHRALEPLRRLRRRLLDRARRRDQRRARRPARRPDLLLPRASPSTRPSCRARCATTRRCCVAAGSRHNPDHLSPQEVLPRSPAPAPMVLGPPDVRCTFGAWRCTRCGRASSTSLLAAGFGRDRAEDVVLAVNEVATNAVEHGAGRRRGLPVARPPTASCARCTTGACWATRCPGCRRRTRPNRAGAGVWIARQLCDSLHVWADAGGTHVRLRAAPLTYGRIRVRVEGLRSVTG